MVLGIVMLTACATAPVPRQIQNSFPLEKSFDPVWQAVIESFAELNLPIMNMEKASGLITTDWISFRGQKDETGYCTCGKAGYPFAETDRMGRFNVYVKKMGLGCEVKINAVFEQHNMDMITNSRTTRTRTCVSTGKLEADIYKLIIEKLK